MLERELVMVEGEGGVLHGGLVMEKKREKKVCCKEGW